MVTLRVALVVLWAAVALDYAAYDGAAARTAARVIDIAELRGAPVPAKKAETASDRAASPDASHSDPPPKTPQEAKGQQAKPESIRAHH